MNYELFNCQTVWAVWQFFLGLFMRETGQNTIFTEGFGHTLQVSFAAIFRWWIV
jgi:hypothetical protein